MLQNVHPNHCGHLHMYMNGIKLNIYLNHSKYSSKSGCDMFPSTCTDAFCLYYSVALHVTKHLPLKFKLLNVGWTLGSVALASSISNDSRACAGLFFPSNEVWPPVRAQCPGAPSWAITGATLGSAWGSGPAPVSSARGLRHTVSRSPCRVFFEGMSLSAGLNGGGSDSGAADVAAAVLRSWVLWLRVWSWLSDFLDALLNRRPMRLLLSWASGGRGALRGEEEGDLTRDENAVVTCWRTSSCLKRSEGDKRRHWGSHVSTCA